MPNNGLPAAACSRITSSRPLSRSFSAASRNAPTPGRSLLNYDLHIPTEKVGTFDTELTEEFFLGFTRNANLTLHIKQLEGKNSHHIIEGAFKSFGRSMKQAVAVDEAFRDEIPSTKGVL